VSNDPEKNPENSESPLDDLLRKISEVGTAESPSFQDFTAVWYNDDADEDPWVGLEDDKSDEEVIAMLELADKYGLGWEVVTAYVNHRKAGDSISQAAWSACYDWDIL